MTPTPITALALVEALAISDDAKQEAALLALCRAWRVAPAYIGNESDYPRWLAVMATVERLARHIVEYQQKHGENE